MTSSCTFTWTVWAPRDLIGWSTMMAWDLSGNHATELLRFALSDRLDAQRLAELFETDPPAPLPDLARLYEGLDRGDVAALMQAIPPGNIDGIGSNNWVVDGRHTVSGKPLLANDPHLGHNSPALWYFAHLSAPGLDAIGATVTLLVAFVGWVVVRYARSYLDGEPREGAFHGLLLATNTL